nr:DUF4097 domain-containing protein [Metabacillus idriensis]
MGNVKDQRKRILDLVEQGKLSASEALTLIEKLEEEYSHKENEMLTSLSSDSFSKDPFVEKEKTAGSSLSSKLVTFIDTAVKKVKELDLDLNFGGALNVQHIYQFKDADIRDFDIQLIHGSVNLQSWTQSDVRVECDAKVYRAENQELARETFMQNVDCSVDGSKFRFYTEKKTVKINMTLYVPEEQYELVKIKLFSGPIRGEDLNVRDFNAKTANGVISVLNFKGEKIEAETANGQIRLTNVEAAHTEAETINGLIHLNGKSERIDVQSFNGNIIVKLEDERCHTLYAKTATGNVDVYVPENVKINGELKSNLGSVAADLKDLEVLFEKNETVQKELRFKSIAASEQTMSVFADSKTGSILLKER